MTLVSTIFLGVCWRILKKCNRRALALEAFIRTDDIRDYEPNTNVRTFLFCLFNISLYLETFLLMRIR